MTFGKGIPFRSCESEMKKVNFTPNVKNRERGKFTKGSMCPDLSP